ncbi:hypothetical protein Vsou_02270 [Vulcanisaeta souniana JCM 11219]|uniref:Uncharacterized protein n=1 Tax=Vulcanisaeta souniana JCM 11219 TaxID=1293586 RepID=A0ABN6SP33_9CREN|nr:hypothetical protein Vsou_02270 [Vulcanisaeta souniana JCM 11219]
MNVEEVIESRVINSLKINLKLGGNYEVKMQRLRRLIRLRRLVNLGL